MTDTATFVMERRFSAPPALVWRAWTEKALLARWYGPGVETVIHELDVRPGGLWLNEMRMGERSMYQRMEYLVVEPPRRLVMTMGTCDAEWSPAPNPMMPDWPAVLLTTVTLQQTEGGTQLRLEWEPHGASDAEVEAFRAAMSGLGQGWGAGMDALEAVLSELA